MNLRQRLPVRGTHDELDDVAHAFNETLARVEDAVGEMRQFSTALAHELRTPIAALRGEIELAARKPGATDEQRQAAASQLEELDKLKRLIGQLLTLARAESGQIPLAHGARRARAAGRIGRRAARARRAGAGTEPGGPRRGARRRSRETPSGSSGCSSTCWTTPSSSRRGAAMCGCACRRPDPHARLEVRDTGVGHAARGGHARVRAVLPRRPGPVVGRIRRRARAQPREMDRRPSRRHRLSRGRAGRRRDASRSRLRKFNVRFITASPRSDGIERRAIERTRRQ